MLLHNSFATFGGSWAPGGTNRLDGAYQISCTVFIVVATHVL